MSALPVFEMLDRRVLGGVVFTDPFGRRVLSPVAVRAADPAVKLMAKRPGEIVVMDDPGLTAQTASFAPPVPPPALGSVKIILDLRPADPALGARRITLALPRNPDASQPDNASTAMIVPLLAAPGGGLAGLAAAVRVSVTRSDDGRAIEGALVRLRPEGGRPEVWALTDAAGEALLLATGVPLASPGPGATVKSDIGGGVDAIVDPALARFHASADIQFARLAAGRRTSGFTDPDDLVARLAATATAPVDVRVAPGRTTTARIAWTPA